MPLSSVDIEAASGGNPALRRVLSDMHQSQTQFALLTGIDPKGSQRTRSDQSLPAPQPGSISVVGVDGHYQIEITAVLPGVNQKAGQLNRQGGGRNKLQGDDFGDLDARKGRKLNLFRGNDGRRNGRQVFEVQSANDLNFDANSGVTSYGPAPQSKWDITDPNQTKFFRYRSRLEGSDFHDWVYYINPAVCGPQAVWSGVLTTHGSAMNNTGNTYTGATPLAQHLLTTRIDVASTAWTLGGDTPIYSSGSVDPGIFGTYYIYVDDAKHAGGTVTYVATSTIADVTANDHRLYFGKITTAGGGGGSGSGGGSGACVIGDCLITMADGSKKAQRDVRKGMEVMAMDGMPDVVEYVDLIPDMPCLSFRTKTGKIMQGCSGSHALKYGDGPFEGAFELHAGDIAQLHDGKQLFKEEIAERSFIGHRTVYRMKLRRTHTYIADGYVSHNLAVK